MLLQMSSWEDIWTERMAELDVLQALQDKDFRKSFLWRTVGPAVSRQIKALRLSRGLTQKQVADGCGTKAPTVSRWENPAYGHTLSLTTLLKIAQFFDVGLVVRLCDWPTYLRWLEAIDSAPAPEPFTAESLQELTA